MVWVVLVIIAVLLFVLFRRSSLPKNLPPGPTPLPLIGNVHQIKFPAIFESFDNWKRDYGDIVSAMLFQKRVIILNSYGVTKEAFVKHADNFSARPNLPVLTLLTGGKAQGYVNTWGLIWKDHRRHALHVLRDFGLGRSFQEEKIEIEIEDLFEEFDKRLNAESGNIDPVLPIKFAIVNIINSMLFGFRYKYDNERFVELQEMIQQNMAGFFRILAFEFLPGFQPFRGLIPYIFPQVRRNVAELRTFFTDIITEHKETYRQDLEDNSGKNSDFVYAYITEMRKRQETDPNSYFNDEQLLWGIFDLFVAGFETTATTLSWFFAYMARYPEVQQKMYDEMRNTADGVPSYGDRSRHPYTNAVIAEVQRCGNIVPTAIMHSCFEDVTICGYNVPAQSLVIPNLWSIMRDPKIFPDPEDFKPERFADENNGDTNSMDSVLAFSIGKRSCLGEGLARMELFMFVAAIVWAYKIEMPEVGTAPRIDDAVVSFTRAPFPFSVKMTRR